MCRQNGRKLAPCHQGQQQSVYNARLLQKGATERSLVTPYVPHMKQKRVVPPTRAKTFGDRAFSVAAPMLWNSLPNCIRLLVKLRQFKKAIKTWLFKNLYESCTLLCPRIFLYYVARK